MGLRQSETMHHKSGPGRHSSPAVPAGRGGTLRVASREGSAIWRPGPFAAQRASRTTAGKTDARSIEASAAQHPRAVGDTRPASPRQAVPTAVDRQLRTDDGPGEAGGPAIGRTGDDAQTAEMEMARAPRRPRRGRGRGRPRLAVPVSGGAAMRRCVVGVAHACPARRPPADSQESDMTLREFPVGTSSSCWVWSSCWPCSATSSSGRSTRTSRKRRRNLAIPVDAVARVGAKWPAPRHRLRRHAGRSAGSRLRAGRLWCARQP